MEDAVIPITICAMLFIGLPWIILHYVSQWRRTKGITIEDENLLDDLHETARRLDARLDSIERIITAENPGWKDSALRGPADRIADRLTDAAEPRLGTRR